MEHKEVGNPVYADKNVSPNMFDSYCDKNQLLVREIFTTVQGEMPFAGHPAVFLRLGGCNRGTKIGTACSACDTDFRVSMSKPYDIVDLAKEVLKLCTTKSGTRLLVITGGEPLLQQKALTKFIDVLTDLQFYVYDWIKIQFETNGDIRPSFDLMKSIVSYDRVGIQDTDTKDRTRIFFVISPKGVSKKYPWYAYPENYSDKRQGNKIPFSDLFFGVNQGSTGKHSKLRWYIRKVVSSDTDSIYYNVEDTVIKFGDLIGESRVFLSPVTLYSGEVVESKASEESSYLLSEDQIRQVNKAANADNLRRAIELCEEHNFIVSFQSHVYMDIR